MTTAVTAGSVCAAAAGGAAVMTAAGHLFMQTVPRADCGQARELPVVGTLKLDGHQLEGNDN